MIAQGKIRCMKIQSDQEVPTWEVMETIRITRNGRPEHWRNDLRKINIKLGEISLEELIKIFDPFDLSGKKTLKSNKREGENTVQLKSESQKGKCCCKNHKWNPSHNTDEYKIELNKKGHESNLDSRCNRERQEKYDRHPKKESRHKHSIRKKRQSNMGKKVSQDKKKRKR